MNLALRDVRHNAFRFVLTALGLGGLLGIVVAMAGIYAGALDDALRLPRASSPDLWIVQPRTKGPFAEPSRIPSDTREFWQRAAQRNRGTAELYDNLGLAEYEAIEGFVRWKE